MFTALDEYLVHQTPETVDRVFTSDRNFYDRYYFGAYSPDGDAYLMVAMGLYPNVGVIDAFATAVIGGETQHIVRASRELRGDRMDTKVGPIGVQIVEPLRRVRVFCEPNDQGLTFDLTFDARTAPFEEPHFFRRSGPRVVMDYTRMTQQGRWSGTFTAGGTTWQVRPEQWRGVRDHSWGIRPVGGGEPPSAPPPDGGGLAGFYWVWSPAQFADACLMYTVSEEPDGRRWHSAAELLYPPESGRAPEQLVVAEHDFRLKPGTRLWGGGSMTVLRDGKPVRFTMTPKTTLYMAGGGYSYLGGWRHGQYHGPLVVETEQWDLRDPAVVAKAGVHTQTICDYTVEGADDLGPGAGVFEFLLLGAYLPYGLKSFTDVAPAAS